MPLSNTRMQNHHTFLPSIWKRMCLEECGHTVEKSVMINNSQEREAVVNHVIKEV